MERESTLEVLKKLTPDPQVIETVEGFLVEENDRPWP
jgi:hypothetical protein